MDSRISSLFSLIFIVLFSCLSFSVVIFFSSSFILSISLRNLLTLSSSRSFLFLDISDSFLFICLISLEIELLSSLASLTRERISSPLFVMKFFLKSSLQVLSFSIFL